MTSHEKEVQLDQVKAKIRKQKQQLEDTFEEIKRICESGDLNIIHKPKIK